MPRDLEEQGKGNLLADIAGGGMVDTQYVAIPDEVGTIVWVSCVARFVGSYSSGVGKAYRTDCTATIIDATRNLLVGETTSSLDPPERTACVAGTKCQVYGGFDHEGFSRYLAAQPRKDFTKPIVPK